jgi:hypothetical protein
VIRTSNGERIQECDGELKLYAVGVKQYADASPDDGYIGGGRTPPEVRCSLCTFKFCLHKEDWALGIFEWMQMAFGMALVHISADRELMRHFSIWRDAVNVCLPETEMVFSREVIDVLRAYNSSGNVLGVWHDSRIMVSSLDFNEPNSLKLLLVGSGIIMTEMEERFQKAIKRSAELASSASESFHPKTRRPAKG